MGSLDSWLRAAGSGVDTSQPASYTLPAPQQSSSLPQLPTVPDKSPIEKFDLNKTFDQITGAGTDIFATAGQLPARAYETPFAIADVAARAVGLPEVGHAVGNFGPVQAAGDVLNKVSTLVPSFINSKDATVWKAVYNLPDSTPITDQLINERLGVNTGLGGLAAPSWSQNSGGFPILGLLGIGAHPKTVGELKAELQKRGFFNDEKTGQPLNPYQVGQALANGQTSIYDYGYAGINDNSLVNLAGRLATDPSNLLFFTPAGAALIGKLGSMATKILPAGEAIAKGLTAAKVLSPLKSAEELAAGAKQAYGASATLKGIATLYRNVAVGSAATTYGLNVASNLAGGQKGPLGWLNTATDSILNDQPLSHNAAFTLFSAATFPYGTYAKGVTALIGKGKVAALGANDFGRIVSDMGLKNVVETIGGEGNLQTLYQIIDANILKAKGRFDLGVYEGIASAPHGASVLELTSPIVARAVNAARKAGEITPAMRDAELVRMASEGAGTAGTASVNPFNAADTFKAWGQHIEGRRIAEPVMRDLAVAVSDRNAAAGEAGVIFREQVDAGLNLFKNEAVGTRYADKTVPKSVVQSFLEEHANVRALDPRPDFWDKALNPKMPDPSLRSLQAKMRALRAAPGTTVKMSDYFGDVARHETTAPSDPTVPGGPVLNDPVARMQELQQQLDQISPQPNGKTNGSSIAPENVAQAQAIQKELEQLKAKVNGIEWAGISEFDKRQGADPAVTKGMDEAAQAALPEAPLPPTAPGIEKFTPEQVAQVHAVEQQIAEVAPRLTLKRAPVNELLNQVLPEDAASIQKLRYYNALGDWLNQSGPLSGISRFAQALTRPVGRPELQRDAKQALVNELMPLGVKPSQVQSILSALDQRVAESFISKKAGIRYYRDIGSILPAQMNEVANAVLNRLMAEGKGAAEATHPAVARIEAQGGFYKIFQKANSRYWRTISQRAAAGGAGSKIASAAYQVWDASPLATPQHAFAKSIYPVFRFMMDPRWWLMNRLEAEVYAFTKAAVARGYADTAQASAMARRFIMTADLGGALSEGGQMFTRNTTALAAKWLDKTADGGVTQILNDLGTTDPALRAMRAGLQREGQQIAQIATSQLADGTIDVARHAEMMKQAQHYQNLSNQDLAHVLNEELFRVQKTSPRAEVMAEAHLQFTPEEFQVVAPLIDKVAENATRQWSDIQRTLHGNPARSTVERILNSPLLFWPLSYQIKATKWLADIMLNGSFGHNNNALLAGVYANWMQQHQERFKQDASYRAFLQAQPEQWFVAQMLLPISPGDIGVSLGKLTDLVGTLGQEKLNQWLNTDIGAFTAQKFTDPSQAVGWLTKLGPMYSADLASRLLKEAGWTDLLGQPVEPAAAPAAKTARDLLGTQPIQQGVPFARP